MSITLELRRVGVVLAEAPTDLDWLDATEHARVERLRVPARRNQYLAGHWLARAVIARRLGLEVFNVVLEERRGLPPAVRASGTRVHLSISHSGDWIGAAVADVPVGIDLEAYPRRHNLIDVEALLLADGEAPGSLDDDRLLQRWVAKEARIKRDASEALPERLRAVRLRIADREQADVRMYRSAEFYLGVAVEPRASLDLKCDVDVESIGGWTSAIVGCGEPQANRIGLW